MCRAVKADLARLVILTAATCKYWISFSGILILMNYVDQFIAAIVGCFNQKIFFDFLTTRLNGIVSPFPALQLFNMVLSITVYALEWPLGQCRGLAAGRSVVLRIASLSLATCASLLMYQATNAALYYSIGFGIYISARRTCPRCEPARELKTQDHAMSEQACSLDIT